MSSDVAELIKEADALPYGWQRATLRHVLSKSEGGGTPPRDIEAYWNGDIPWASVKDVVKGEGTAPEETITSAGLANSTSKLIAAGTNVFAARMGVGAVVRYPFPVAINQDLMALTPASDLDAGFLFYWLQARKKSFAAVATGTTVKGIRKDVLLSFPINLPPIDEQKRIAEVLGSVDEVIAAQSALCWQLRQTTDDLADEVFAREIAHCGSDLVTYGDACESVQVGIVIKPASYYVDDGGVHALRSTNIKRNQIDFSALVQLSQEGHRINKKSALRAGDVVTIRTGEPGKTAVIPANAPSALNCIDIIFSRPKPDLRSSFAAYFINSGTARRQIAAMQGGLAQQHFNVGEMKKLSLPVPSLDRQDNVVSVLDAAWQTVHAGEAQLDTLQATKAALMSDLLSGLVRVPA